MGFTTCQGKSPKSLGTVDSNIGLKRFCVTSFHEPGDSMILASFKVYDALKDSKGECGVIRELLDSNISMEHTLSLISMAARIHGANESALIGVRRPPK